MYKARSIGPIQISALTKAEFLNEVLRRMKMGEQTFVTTPYSEFLYAALRSGEVRDLLMKADLAIADGVGILWAERFLAKPFRAQSHFGKIVESWWQVIISGAQILLQPQSLYQTVPEKIVGAEVFFDMCQIAVEHNYTVFLLNDWSDSAERTAALLKQRHPQLKVSFSTKAPDDASVVADINAAGADILFVGYGPLKQERWINDYLPRLRVRLAMGVGGTFDYAAGNKLRPPRWVRRRGLEWLFRLVTQPRRLPRIYRATYGLILSLVRYKVFHSYSFRPNAVAVVVNHENKILLCKRVPGLPKNGQSRLYLDNYWQFPQGGIDEGEAIVPAASRELAEETGIQSVEVMALLKATHQYEWPHGARSVLFRRGVRRHKGQKQHTVIFRFLGEDSEVEVDSVEFVDYAWLSPEDVLKRIAPECRPHALVVLEELAMILKKGPSSP